MRNKLTWVYSLLTVSFLYGCGGGGGGSSPEPIVAISPPQPIQLTVIGSVATDTVSGADVRLFKFESDGTQTEIDTDLDTTASTTDDTGHYRLIIGENALGAQTGPLVLAIFDGTMLGRAAPSLEAIIADPAQFAGGNETITLNLTPASTVAAAMLRINSLESMLAPTAVDANVLLQKVEQELGISFDDDPGDSMSSIAMFNRDIVENLNLNAEDSPGNANDAVNELIDYFVQNLRSSSAKLDNLMRDTDTGLSVEASFDQPNTRLLSARVPGGPSSFRFAHISLDKAQIENDGLDTAFITSRLTDATGRPVADGSLVMVENTEGRIVISDNMPSTTDGESKANISSVYSGPSQIKVSHQVNRAPSATEDESSTTNEPTFVMNEGLLINFDVVNNDPDTPDLEKPQIVSAGATTNTEILVTFSEPMRGGINSAENARHYRIRSIDDRSETKGITVNDTDAPKRAEVVVVDAKLILPERQTVRLTTLSMSDLQYELSVTAMTDLQGNPMAPPQSDFPNPSSATFQGRGPSGDTVVDTDNDGLSDSDELRGWTVTTITAAGVVQTVTVTSDPTIADTDGDGVSDAEEFHGGLDPRSADSDGDTLTDDQEWNFIFSDGLNQDSDGDGLQDGFEFNVLKTSPNLADTDGDQISDPEEVAAGNRNPLVADLPSPRINIGNVNLQLDTRFTFTDESGMLVTENKTTETTITRSEDESFSSSNETSTKSTLEASQELTGTYNSGSESGQFPGYSVSLALGSQQGSEQGNTFSAGEQSSRASEEAYHDSLTTSTERDIRESITREIVDAVVKVDVSVDNAGDIPFTVSNLELSAQTQDPLDRRRIIPVASLVPENESLESINIGALGDPSRGPFVFKTVSVFPQQVQELMKNPRGFVIQLANFDITDALGTNFAFTSRDVLDRTAGISFDLGDGRVENYRVATSSIHDPASGRPAGITMGYALEVIGLQRYVTIRDGGNGVVDTLAVDGDEQLLAVGAAVEPNEVIVAVGDNQTLSTVPQGDDILVEADYATSLVEDFDTIGDGGNGLAETTASGDDLQNVSVGSAVVSGQPIIAVGPNGVLDTIPLGDDAIDLASEPPRRMLTRFRDVAADVSTKRFWALFQPQARPGVDLDNYIIRSGEQFNFAYVQDKDEDGVWAREEFLHGSSDLLVNTDGCTPLTAADQCDSLSDKEEIQDGWRVQLRGSPQAYPVYPNPNQGDSDRDGLLDHEERNCLLDPRLRDSDLDGLTDWEELTGMRIVEGAITQMVSRDPDTNLITYVITPYEGAATGCDDSEPPTCNLIPHDVIVGCNTEIDALTGVGFATDPLNADTDGDLVNDAVELSLGINPNDSQDGPLFLDDDGDGVANFIEETGFTTYVNGVEVTFTSNPNNPDTDGDLLPDLLEHFIRSNPRSVDTDGDGISDNNEYRNGGAACVTQNVGETCVSFADLIESSFQSYLSECEAADVCNNTTIEQTLASLNQYGTNLNEKDSDFDSVDDLEEIVGVTIQVNDLNEMVNSDPIANNSDADLLDDGEERMLGSNPREADTDGDGRFDHIERDLGLDPAFRDRLISVSSSGFRITTAAEDGEIAEMVWWANVNNSQVCFLPERTVNLNEFVDFTCIYITNAVLRDDGSSITVTMAGHEVDGSFDGIGMADNDEVCNQQTVVFTYDEPSTNSIERTHICNSGTPDLGFTTTLTVTEQ